MERHAAVPEVDHNVQASHPRLIHKPTLFAAQHG